ncbi:MAG: hypothetical protein C3L25_10960 [Candidatus Sedimenticola endophacoides]|uniref:Cache domain-containing protein n=1 Tax=Candidatus Sedimenticola endophacoides TaxID=2548426 RepID=A0A6N4DZR9_9GAMM|nr:MAG: hypothetical protein C3L26_11095 [Candidatus Sedimenticola endophacoides]PUE02324.1 MAG: hypothetical protein C3L25_10960 [Candidatus Sedimenticola endophacoides]PUE04059.1 MAG: hypothetical protein C3L24_03750 [Candidatus Sedimenticola endophacoides]
MLWQFIDWSRERALGELERKSRAQLQLYTSHLQGQLEKYEFLPELLATNERLVNRLRDPGNAAEVEAINRYLESINRIADASDTYLMNSEGLTIAASNWRMERPFVGSNFAYRPYFQEAMRGRLGRYFALGTTSNKRGYYFAYPVRHGGEILGAVVVKINMREIEESWSRADQEMLVTDPDGVIFITTRKGWRYKTLAPLEVEVRERIRASRRYVDEPLDSLDLRIRGERGADARLLVLREGAERGYLAVEQEMAEAGWKVHILAATRPALNQVLRMLLGLLFALLLGGMLVLFWLQRRRRVRERERFKRQEQRNLRRNYSPYKIEKSA